ncbi:MAG: hypothetical protein HYZ29_08720 [Myxococcales bacterium]|nr:hypothetical protein [Myxococcales bacterium]
MPTPTEDIVTAIEAIERLIPGQAAAPRTFLGLAAMMVRRAARYVVVQDVVASPAARERLRRVGVEVEVEDQRADPAMPIQNAHHTREDRDLEDAAAALLSLKREPIERGSHRAVAEILRRRSAEVLEAGENSESVLNSISMEIAPYCSIENSPAAVKAAVMALGNRRGKFYEHVAALMAGASGEHVRKSLAVKK